MFSFHISRNLISFKILILLFLSLFLFNCAGTLENDLKKLDEIYGYCDNPQRNIKGNQYQTCKAKERAAGPSGKSDEKTAISFDTILDKVQGVTSRSPAAPASINPFLWRASLEVVAPYDLKIADNQGGFLQTEWIYDTSNPNSRCMIKIQINSVELISNGVDSFITCQRNLENIWQNDDTDYAAEEKKIILKILELAGNYSSENS